jgi:toxin HigB-1
MIQTWRGKDARAIFNGETPRSVSSDIARAARRRLVRVHEATSVEDLRSPPSHRLHKVGEDVWSVSVNMQFRITFRWGDAGPEDVWFGDYH